MLIVYCVLLLTTGQKPHECSKCGKRFALGCNMKAHMKTHENMSAATTVPSIFSSNDVDGNDENEEEGEEEIDEEEIDVEETGGILF